MNQNLATIPTGSRYSVNGTEMHVEKKDVGT